MSTKQKEQVGKVENAALLVTEAPVSGLRKTVTKLYDLFVPEVTTWTGARGPGPNGMLRKFEEKAIYPAGTVKEIHSQRMIFGLIGILGIKPKERTEVIK